MVCPDCKAKVLSFDEYCKKCGANLYAVNQESQVKKAIGLFRTF